MYYHYMVSNVESHGWTQFLFVQNSTKSRKKPTVQNKVHAWIFQINNIESNKRAQTCTHTLGLFYIFTFIHEGVVIKIILISVPLSLCFSLSAGSFCLHDWAIRKKYVPIPSWKFIGSYRMISINIYGRPHLKRRLCWKMYGREKR